MGTTPAAWQTDPTGIFDQRWWDGQAWTDRVRAGGREATCALDAPPVEAQRVAATLRPALAATPPPAPPPAPMTAAPSASMAATAPPVDEAYAVTATAARPTTPPPPPPPPGARTDVGSPPHAPLPRPATVDDRWAWAIVGLPVVSTLVLLLTPGIPSWMAALSPVFMAVNVGLMLGDVRANPAITARESRTVMLVLGVVLMPVYLFKRQRALGRGLAPFWTYLAVAVVSVGVAMAQVGSALSSTFLDPVSVETQIEQQVLAETRIAVEVSCPGLQPATAGHTFTCRLEDEFRSLDVRVRMLDAQQFVWELAGP